MADRTDWVAETVESFVTNAADIDPTDPVKAIEAHFEKNASDELKARCKAEGKDAKGCWRFIEAVARKVLRGHSGHIDPAVVYAIAMHWFQDVPKDWNEPAAAKPVEKKPVEKKPVEKPAPKKPAAKKPKHTTEQGFFFDLMEDAK